MGTLFPLLLEFYVSKRFLPPICFLNSAQHTEKKRAEPEKPALDIVPPTPNTGYLALLCARRRSSSLKTISSKEWTLK